METELKNDVKDGLVNPEVDRDSKAKESNDQSTIWNNSELYTGTPPEFDIFGVTSSPISWKLGKELSKAGQSETSLSDKQLLSNTGLNILSVRNSNSSLGKTGQMKPSFKFLPRVLLIHNKNPHVPKHKVPKPQDHTPDVLADPLVNKVNSEHPSRSREETVEQSTSDVKDLTGSDVNHEDPTPAIQSSNSPNEEDKVNSDAPPALGPGHKENEDPSFDPYEEFDHCARHPNCKLSLEEVKCMADRLPSCMGIRVRVNYIRQIYKQGRDPDTWDWKKYEDVLPDYTFLLSQPIPITKGVPHPNCKVGKSKLTSLSQILPYSKSRKCFVFLCFYHGLDPEETLKRISENPLVPWVACPEPWRALESSQKPPEYPRVKEGYYTPKASSSSRSQVTPSKPRIGESSMRQSNLTQESKAKDDTTVSPLKVGNNAHSSTSLCTLPNAASGPSTESASTVTPTHDSNMSISSCSQSDPPSGLMTNDGTPALRPESDIDSSASTTSKTRSRKDAAGVKLKTRYKIIYSGNNTAMNFSSPSTSSIPVRGPIQSNSHSGTMSRRARKYRDSNPNRTNRARPFMNMENPYSPVRNPNYHQFNGWYPQQQMANFHENQYHSNQYPTACNNFYSSWNGYQGANFSPWNASSSFNGGGTYNSQSNSYPTPNSHAWNALTYCSEFSTSDLTYCSEFSRSDLTWNNSGDSISDECNSSLMNGSTSWDLSANQSQVVDAVSVKPHSLGSFSGDCRPLVYQYEPLEPGEIREDKPKTVPLPPGTSFQEFVADWSRAVVTPSHSSKSVRESSSSSLEIGDQPPLPSVSAPPLPSDPPPSILPPPPLPPSPPPLPPPLPPLKSEPEEMDWMELESTKYENQQVIETIRKQSTDREAIPGEPLRMAETTKKLTIPKFTMQNRQSKNIAIHKFISPRRNRKSSSGSDVAYKDPASFKSTCDADESSKASQMDPKRSRILVFVQPVDYPHSRLSDEQMTLIENNILDAILEIDKNGVKPIFNESFRRNGRYGVVCSDDFSRKWLYAYLKMRKPWPNANLCIVQKDFTEIRASAVLPICLDENNDKILRFIERQNEGLDVSKWEVVRRWESGDFKTCMNLVIDEKSAKLLEKRNCIIFKMGTGRINVVQNETIDSKGIRDLKKSSESDSLEDDIYADFYEEESDQELEKSTEFDSLEHDIYADFYGEKPSVGYSRKAKPTESNEYTDSDRSRLRNEPDEFIRGDSPRRPSSRSAHSHDRYQHDWYPSRYDTRRDGIPKDKRRWSPRPGGGLCSSQDPYSRKEGIVKDCHSRKRCTRWASRSPSSSRRNNCNSPGGRTPPYRSERTDHDGDDNSFSGNRDYFLKHVCRPRGSPSPCRCNDQVHSMDSKSLETPEGSTSGLRTPRRFSQSQASPDRYTSKSRSTFPRILSFQTQECTDEALLFCPSLPKLHPWNDFIASGLLNNLKDEGSDMFGSDMLQSSGLPNSPQFPGQIVPDVTTEDHWDEDGSQIDSYLHDSDQDSITSSISYEHPSSMPLLHFSNEDSGDKRGSPADENLQYSSRQSCILPISIHNQHHNQQAVADKDDKVDNHPIERDSQDSDQESSKLLTSVYHHPVQQDVTNDDDIKNRYPSESGSPDSDQDSSDLPVSIEYRPGQPLQDVATDQFRKLIAAGYSCEKALHVTQAFVSRQLNPSPKPQPEPLKRPSPQPPVEPTLHQVAADKFSQLVAAGIPHDKALQFTQEFVQRQMVQAPPTHSRNPKADNRDTDMRVETDYLTVEAEPPIANFPADGCCDQFQTNETQEIDEWVDELL